MDDGQRPVTIAHPEHFVLRWAKNRFVYGSGALIIPLCGTQYEDIDAQFSRISSQLQQHDAESLRDLLKLLLRSSLLNDCLNIKDFLEPHLNSVKHHTLQHHFKVVRNMYTVNIFYKIKPKRRLDKRQKFLPSIPAKRTTKKTKTRLWKRGRC